MIEMNEKSRALLADAVQQAGAYTPGHPVKVCFARKGLPN